ncbi:beta strand repeat-containing protein, partial [Streptomyces sp. 8N706]|uniref:beta strand repeat-containing protein n=1 Tax=Streptomyces sp. 8N706 TaxID=3457416 RepID=UPI003FD10B85
PGAGTPTGTVTFTISGGGGTTTIPVDTDGTATLTLNTLPSGSHTVTATYNGDSDFAASTGTDTHTVNRAATTITVTSTPDPSVFGQPVVFTAVVASVAPGAGTPTGAVTFSVSGGGPTLTGALDASGVASVSISTLPAGDYSVTATYDGDTNYASSASSDAHTVNRASTTTTVTSTPDPSVFGQDVTFTAVVAPVSPGAGVPTGTVTLLESGGGTITIPLDASGVASVTSNALAARTYSGTATYNGDANYAPSTGTDTHVVERASTTTTVTTTPDPSVFGQDVTITAVVTPLTPGTRVPTGTVTLTESGGGTITLPLDSNGVATLTTNALRVGTISGTATYNGNANYAPSTGTDTHVVEQASTTTTVTTTPDPSVYGQDVMFSATVTSVAPGAGTPTGTVTFTIDGTSTLTGTLAGGVATVTHSALAAGSHTVEAAYNGDASFTPSTGSDAHTVDRAATTTAVSSSPDPSVFGQPVVFTAAVAPVAPGVGTPTGTVTFTISGGGGTTTVPVDTDGTATLTLNALPSGSHSVNATYNGDTNYTPSTGTDTHTVNQAATTTTVTSSPDPSALGQTVTIRATVDAELAVTGTPSGTVTFVISGSGGGTFTEALD